MPADSYFSNRLSPRKLLLAEEFKDAIASLSPEQQQFAKAFRAMQLDARRR